MILSVMAVMVALGVTSCGGGSSSQSSGSTSKTEHFHVGDYGEIKVTCFGGITEDYLSEAYKWALKGDDMEIRRMVVEGKGYELFPTVPIKVLKTTFGGNCFVRADIGIEVEVWILDAWIIKR